MGLFDRLTGRTKQMEAVRIKHNQDDANNLYYDPKATAKDISSESDDILNMNEINKFRLLKTDRSERYQSFDLMAQDSRIASILNMYADDCTQYNQSGKVIWAESSDPNCADFANRIIDNLQLNKYARTHIYSLCKYGDCYLQLFYDDEINNPDENNFGYKRGRGASLEERVEMVRNPASLFDLKKHGKTAYYVSVKSTDEKYDNVSQKLMQYHYYEKEGDMVLPPDKYIHISINDAYTRFPNKYILTNTQTGEEESYLVDEGSSILANVFKVWSELNLLEDSVLLNRLSKSAIIRLIQIEVGNTDDNDVQEILKTLRDKISRTRYFDKGSGDYKNQVNPGPLENIIYHATHKGNGTISHSTIGGDVDVKALADLDHFLEKLAQGLNTPLAYVKQTNDDGGGLSAGTSLTKFDARYGRTLKRIQNAYIYGIVDLINVFAYKRGVTEYMNNFTIKMVSPSAVEDNERDEKLKNHTDMIRDLMDILNNLEDAYEVQTKKEILNYMIQTLLQDNGLNEILAKDMEDEKNNPIPEEAQETMDVNDEVEI